MNGEEWMKKNRVSDLVVKDWGEAPYNMMDLPFVELTLLELHHKSNAAKGDKPGFMFMSQKQVMGPWIGCQVSVEMLARALKKLGYRLEKEER